MRISSAVRVLLVVGTGLLTVHPNVEAYEINDMFRVGGVMAGMGQYQDFMESDGSKSTGGGAFCAQPELSFTPTQSDEIFLKLGLAVGNGLNEDSPYVLAPLGADLEDGVQDINGSGRDYLLTAWYKHTFKLGQDHQLGITGGLIDATDYLDENAFANCEYTQFMNEALVNGPNAFAPSYDVGGALEWDFHKLGARFVVMNVAENDDGNNFTFFGLQLSYTLETSLGVGTYRILIDGTTADFLDPRGQDEEHKGCILFSFDQEFGEIFGGFLRFGWQDEKAAVDCRAIYSGGINISGRLWRREQDNIGVAFGFLDGGNLDLERTLVSEAYARLALHEYLALTLDLQYMDDRYVQGGGPRGFIFGARLAAEF